MKRLMYGLMHLTIIYSLHYIVCHLHLFFYSLHIRYFQSALLPTQYAPPRQTRVCSTYILMLSSSSYTHTHTHTHTRTFFSKCICMHACLYAVVVQDLQYVTPIHQYQYWYDITFTHIHSNVFLRVYVPLPIGLGFCLYKAGYENITNIDISPSIILQMTHLMQKGRERGRDRGSVESIGPCNVDCKSP